MVPDLKVIGNMIVWNYAEGGTVLAYNLTLDINLTFSSIEDLKLQKKTPNNVVKIKKTISNSPLALLENTDFQFAARYQYASKEYSVLGNYSQMFKAEKGVEKYEIEFLRKACESVASMVSGFRISEHTARLLDESQMQSEQLRAQEEEMRQNLEELAATQEEMDRKQRDLLLSEEKSKAILDTTPGAILTLKSNGKIDTYNLSAKKMFGIIGNENLSINQLVPELSDSVIEANMQKASFELTAVSLTGKQFNSEIFLNNFEVIGDKINVVVISDITEKKEKENQKKIKSR
jgi:PAS domain S-box-containing protein